MIDTERAVNNRFPAFAHQSELIRKPALTLLRKLTHEQEVNQFLDSHRDLGAIDFIDHAFDHFNITYRVSARERQNIPAQGKILIIANHPIGSMDGLAILRLVMEVRRDVKIVADEFLTNIDNLSSSVIASKNLSESAQQVKDALANDHAVILFPANRISKSRPGIKDSRWKPSFLNFARTSQSPVLPIFMQTKNSLLAHSAQFFLKPIAGFLATRKMYDKRQSLIEFRVGEPIDCNALYDDQLNDRTLIHRLRKHLYKLKSNRKPQFETVKTIAHPEDRSELKSELKESILLGETRDQNSIFLAHYEQQSLMREIGRLREFTFRKVGEGTGSRRDLDSYDCDYDHLVLWNHDRLEIAGSYRIGHTRNIVESKGINGLYTRSLFEFEPEFENYLSQAMELGRSFVHPSYWGKNSLDYLWQGIGAYIRHNPEIRYVFGPVSMSASYSKALAEELVYYYEHFYGTETTVAKGKMPFVIREDARLAFDQKYQGLNKDEGMKLLQAAFSAQNCKMPVLFKQYASLYEEGGFKLLAFNIDPDFADCIDGLFIADLTTLKAAKRKRYIG
ncbi:GNAT family N-acyltransferase [Sessilibacter corallicola]|uniref:GNAT family N-acyltransferase n=1 Tax=Sessilibacter corallicola TaxID=2904075 RepID=UPI001E43506C|nr:lysophospholipid acyltransferase family protein [Sessilibacter corallicola]MCE2027432.1 lysophospholipid acyltransferase family protein [Sessilibacter corallicola]